MKRMQNVTSGAYGVVEDFMIMDDEPVLGDWYITATAHAHYRDGSYYSETVCNKVLCQIFKQNMLKIYDFYNVTKCCMYILFEECFICIDPVLVNSRNRLDCF